MAEIRMVVVHGYVAHEVDAQVREILGDYVVEDDYQEGGWMTHICTNVEAHGVTSMLYEILDVATTFGRDVYYAKRGLLEEPEVVVDGNGDRWTFLGNIHGYNEDGVGRYQE